MARYTGPVCRLCRREEKKLFLKGERCHTEKCAIERRSWAPGQHGKDYHTKLVGYGLQLREKQKVKRMYGVLENQFRIYFFRAERQKGITGENLLVLLERRLDNVVYRLGFATSRSQARQWVRHGHIFVNGRRVTIPSFSVKPEDVVSLHPNSVKNEFILRSVETIPTRGGVPSWLELDTQNLQGKIVSLPKREHIQIPIEEQLIVELYSK